VPPAPPPGHPASETPRPPRPGGLLVFTDKLKKMSRQAVIAFVWPLAATAFSLWPSTSPPSLTEPTDCPAGCAGHGLCRDGTCHCDIGWRGADCATSACRFMCHGHGHCQVRPDPARTPPDSANSACSTRCPPLSSSLRCCCGRMARASAMQATPATRASTGRMRRRRAHPGVRVTGGACHAGRRKRLRAATDRPCSSRRAGCPPRQTSGRRSGTRWHARACAAGAVLRATSTRARSIAVTMVSAFAAHARAMPVGVARHVGSQWLRRHRRRRRACVRLRSIAPAAARASTALAYAVMDSKARAAMSSIAPAREVAPAMVDATHRVAHVCAAWVTRGRTAGAPHAPTRPMRPCTGATDAATVSATVCAIPAPAAASLGSRLPRVPTRRARATATRPPMGSARGASAGVRSAGAAPTAQLRYAHAAARHRTARASTATAAVRPDGPAAPALRARARARAAASYAQDMVGATSTTCSTSDAHATRSTRAPTVRWQRIRRRGGRSAPCASALAMATVRGTTRVPASARPGGRASTASGCYAQTAAPGTASAPMPAANATAASQETTAQSKRALATALAAGAVCVANANATRGGRISIARSVRLRGGAPPTPLSCHKRHNDNRLSF
jgi:hypothetical protein